MPTTRCSPTPAAFYDQVIEIDLDTLTPHINGPHTPDRAREVKDLGRRGRRRNGWPTEISAALIGSCTNSSYEDITRAASIAREAAAKGLRAKSRLLVTPGSEQVRATIVRDGLLQDFEALGRRGAGQRLRSVHRPVGPLRGDRPRHREPNVIVTSYNRNFPKRNDGDPATLAFVTSPETVIALAIAGRVDFDPINDTLTNDAGEEVRLSTPVGVELPPGGIRPGRGHLRGPTRRRLGGRGEGVTHLRPAPAARPPSRHGTATTTRTCRCSSRPQGKFTTDHISMAGPWLKYRGHLENISGNLYLGAVNAYPGYEVGYGKNQLTGRDPDLPRHGPLVPRRPASRGW